MRTRAFSALQLVLCLLVAVFACVPLFAMQDDDEVPANFLAGMGKPLHPKAGVLHGKGTIPTPHGFPQGVDSLVNFTVHFEEAGVYLDGSPHHIWEYSMVGNSPVQAGTTTYNAPIVPVTIDLRNFDGSPKFVNRHRLISSPDAFVQPGLNSQCLRARISRVATFLSKSAMQFRRPSSGTMLGLTGIAYAAEPRRQDRAHHGADPRHIPVRSESRQNVLFVRPGGY